VEAVVDIEEPSDGQNVRDIKHLRNPPIGIATKWYPNSLKGRPRLWTVLSPMY
jgi:hypothetical protein